MVSVSFDCGRHINLHSTGGQAALYSGCLLVHMGLGIRLKHLFERVEVAAEALGVAF